MKRSPIKIYLNKNQIQERIKLSKSQISAIPYELFYLATFMKIQGVKIKLVGGAVRDLFWDCDPCDFDLSMNVPPAALISIADKFKIRYIMSGVKYGTISIRPWSRWFEITSLRKDKLYDGRRPKEVKFITESLEDAARRDFTFNSMFVDLETKTLSDPFGGRSDLKGGRLRFVGNYQERIREDRLRILRWYRFKILFSKEGWTWGKKKIIPLSLKGISPDRIYQEFIKLFSIKKLSIKKLGKIPLGSPFHFTKEGLKKLSWVEQQICFLPPHLRVATRIILSSNGNLSKAVSSCPKNFTWLRKRFPSIQSFLPIRSRYDLWSIFFLLRDERETAFLKSLISLPGEKSSLIKFFRFSCLLLIHPRKFWPSLKGIKVWPPAIKNLNNKIIMGGKFLSKNEILREIEKCPK